jgi:hypothetical protein
MTPSIWWWIIAMALVFLLIYNTIKGSKKRGKKK